MRTVDEVINALPSPAVARLPAPVYAGPKEDARPRLGLAVASMQNHTTDEGWQIFAGLEADGWRLAGHGLPLSSTNVPHLLEVAQPGVVLMQDVREWDVQPRDFRDPRARFFDVKALTRWPDLFVGTILKDAQQRPDYHRASAAEIGAHYWLCYYHPRIVAHLAPYVRVEHLIRTYHTIDPAIVPAYSPEDRKGCLLSGAVSGAYPLRSLLVSQRKQLPMTTYLPHPGYDRRGCRTPEFLRILSGFRVAICTSSRYGYLLRKLIEATAAGCVVITDLPADEVAPAIDANFVRVRSDVRPKAIAELIEKLCDDYDPERQRAFAQAAIERYDYHVETARLAAEIEALRRRYP